MANNEQVRRLVQQIVREEISRMLPTLIKEAMGSLIIESMQTANASASARPAPRQQRPIHETVETGYEEYPTLNRTQMAQAIGYGSLAQRVNPNLITVDSMNSEHEAGQPRPIDPNAIPDHVLQAFNKDYRPLMKALESRK